MSSRMRRPEAVTLRLSNDDWLLVKAHLTAGETRELFRRIRQPDSDRLDPMLIGYFTALAYLLDWSITDADEQPVVIKDQPEDVVAAALNALTPEDYVEILRAIEDHDERMALERAEEKKRQSGTRTSVTPFVSAG